MRSSIRSLLIVGIAITLVSCSGGTSGPSSLGSLTADRVIDLTHAFDQSTIYWPTETEGFQLGVRSEGMNPKGFFYAAKSLAAPEHGGTHIDAPYHFWQKGRTVDEIPVEQLIGPGVRIDVSARCADDPDTLVTVADFEAHEAEHGPIPDGAIVLLYTGFGKYWPDRVKYMATDELGAEAVPKLHFPGLDPEAARWLLDERSIGAIGLDTPSIDYGQSEMFQSHVTLFSENVPALENVANLDRVPPRGFDVVVLPMKIRGGTGGPARIIGILRD